MPFKNLNYLKFFSVPNSNHLLFLIRNNNQKLFSDFDELDKSAMRIELINLIENEGFTSGTLGDVADQNFG